MSRPIKRTKHIVQLSKEHHFALLFCWKLRTGIKKKVDIDRMMNYIGYFYENCLLPHFVEEDILYAAHITNKMVKRAYAEHLEINGLIKRLTCIDKENGLETIENLASVIENHVRYEERELFPFLEEAIEESKLAEIGKKLSIIQPKQLQDLYEDEFWK